MPYIYDALVYATILADLLLLLMLMAYPIRFSRSFFRFISRHSIKFALAISLIATLGSLYFSEILGWQPCRLCWFQRIFMYPLPIIFGIALWKKDKGIWRYTLPLAMIGSLFSIYHYYIQRFPVETTCSATGVSCASISFAFGYISIPIMALTAFAFVILLGMLARKK